MTDTDLGAEQSFMDKTLARRLGVPLVSLHVPLHVGLGRMAPLAGGECASGAGLDGP